MAIILEKREDGVIKLWFEGVLADYLQGDVVELEEYDADNCNGGQPTGKAVYAALGWKGDFIRVGKGVDGFLWFSPKYDYPLFQPISVQW